MFNKIPMFLGGFQTGLVPCGHKSAASGAGMPCSGGLEEIDDAWISWPCELGRYCGSGLRVACVCPDHMYPKSEITNIPSSTDEARAPGF